MLLISKDHKKESNKKNIYIQYIYTHTYICTVAQVHKQKQMHF